MLYLKLIPEEKLKICDIGSGAGFPGIPIAIVRPQIDITLIEPSKKKTAFLRHMKRVLSLKNIEILEKRVEDVTDLFDIAVSRALFNIEELIKKASHLIKKDGYFVLSKGPRYKEELITIPKSINTEVMEIDLPFSDAKRYLIKVYLSRS